MLSVTLLRPWQQLEGHGVLTSDLENLFVVNIGSRMSTTLSNRNQGTKRWMPFRVIPVHDIGTQTAVMDLI